MGDAVFISASVVGGVAIDVSQGYIYVSSLVSSNTDTSQVYGIYRVRLDGTDKTVMVHTSGTGNYIIGLAYNWMAGKLFHQYLPCR